MMRPRRALSVGVVLQLLHQLIALLPRGLGDLPHSHAIDPAVRDVQAFIDLLRPWWRRVLAVRRALTPSHWFKR